MINRHLQRVIKLNSLRHSFIIQQKPKLLTRPFNTISYYFSQTKEKMEFKT